MGLFSRKNKKLEPPKKAKKGIDIELTEEDLDKAIGGIPFDAVDKAERKSWELTEEQLEAARAEKVSDELSEEELDNVRAGSHEPDGR